MTLIPFQDGNGSPDVGAMYVNAVLCASLYHQDKSCAELYASLSGSLLLDWISNPAIFPPDYMVFRNGLDCLVVLDGTTNATQWLTHYGGSVIPFPDPITGDTVLGSVWSGSVQPFEVIGDLVSAAARSGGTIRFAGHSYGGGSAYLMGTWLTYLTPGRVEVETFGEPKIFGGIKNLKEPPVHFRIVAADPAEGNELLTTIDPVSQLPPGAVQYMGLGYIAKIAALVFHLKFQARGQAVYLFQDRIEVVSDNFLWSVPFASEFLLANLIIPGTHLHLMDSSYLPRAHAAWQSSGLYPELAAFEPFYAAYTGNQFVPPTNAPPSLSLDFINQALELQATPITPTNQGDWTNVSSVGFLVAPGLGAEGKAAMTLMKGSLLCTVDNQGFSESFHSISTGDTYASMKTKMTNIANARIGLSNGVNDPGPAAVNNKMAIVALRISDELLVRDVLPVPFTVPTGWNGTTGNAQGNVAIKIVWRSPTGQQIAVSYLHCVPNGGMNTPQSGNEARLTPMTATWTNALQAYCNVVAAQGLGFATINNNPTNALGPITAVTYNTVSGYYTFTTTNAVPQGKFRVALRGFKSLRVLNGRQSAQAVASNQFQVYKRAAQVAWDNSGTAVPLSGYSNNVPFYNYVIVAPATATPSLLTTRKLGRPFFLQAGRVTRKAG